MSEPALPKSVTSEFRWMHLSDLHVGMMEQDWLWPTLKHSLYADMEMMLASAGPLDAMIFSGDLTQRGIPDEFDKLDSILGELWDKFRSWGFSPKLLVLPGNHDICRAPSLSPELRLLRKWWEEPEIHGDFFGSDFCIYRDAASALLAPYRAWATRNSTRFELLRGTNGLLPGDQSHVVRVGDFDIGIVNLNSTWLQIDGADYKGKLHVVTLPPRFNPV